jgi:hypothetical protein
LWHHSGFCSKQGGGPDYRERTPADEVLIPCLKGVACNYVTTVHMGHCCLPQGVHISGVVWNAHDVLYRLVEEGKELWMLPTDCIHVWLESITHGRRRLLLNDHDRVWWLYLLIPLLRSDIVDPVLWTGCSVRCCIVVGIGLLLLGPRVAWAVVGKMTWLITLEAHHRTLIVARRCGLGYWGGILRSRLRLCRWLYGLVGWATSCFSWFEDT